ncbi:amino acid ABC transporter ATP-binding protein [Nocardioides marmoriginsengisoli]|uniref:ABC-type polar-amino-acid transporter n=1 Tax=Nocardioides marmoriginsengisoli TaxID=661483 RepID=A0A3N0CIM9_9ACTN|nr:amino acid ABC transporter ATP-binding protein [Nocardioides marmoriginsengisoli]RNL63302.1 amino acid ABC transporter ATP-binding protein [Nocardioides marmoriginsengisoli]
MTPESKPLLTLDGVCVAYRHQEVVHDVSLDVAAGEVVALIGPSGAGKSSLLRAINFLEPPSKGRILLEGVEVGGSRRTLDALRRDVGMVFQSFNLFPHLTALQNVMLAPEHTLGLPREQARERAMRQLTHVGLAERADAKPGKCSGGQQQRIAIARALAMEPKVMLFDEPTSALDPELGAEVLATMRTLAGEGMTMVVVTHEMHFAEDVADRVVFMADGHVVEENSAGKLMRDPQHPRTQRFLNAVRGR